VVPPDSQKAAARHDDVLDLASLMVDDEAIDRSDVLALMVSCVDAGHCVGRDEPDPSSVALHRTLRRNVRSCCLAWLRRLGQRT
jgi:hypothetical protein